MSAYLSLMGWPDIYIICFSQLDGDKDSLLLDGDKDYLLLDVGFSFLIAVRLIRDNWKAVIGNYPTSLISEIWFDLQDMSSCFGPIFGGCHQWPIASTEPVYNPVLGLRLGHVHLLFQTTSVAPPPPPPPPPPPAFD